MNALLVSHCASSAVWVATSVHRQPFVPLHLCIDSHLCRCIVQRLCVAVFMHPCITALCGCLYASLHNDFGRPPSCILCTFMNALLVSHPCETLGVHFIRHPCLTRKLRVLPPAAPKNNTPLVERAKVWRGVELRSFGSLHRAATLCDRHRASMHVVLALLVSHPCETLGKHYHASLRLWSFGSARPCADSHLCRCIVQRLCVAVFMHPCITTLCDRYRASLHVYERSVGFASCETPGVHFIRPPCLTRKLRVLPPTNTQKV